MPVYKPIAILVAVLVVALPVAALQSDMTEEDYGKAMTTIQSLVGEAELHIDTGYWPDLQGDLQGIRRQFNAVEAFWTTRGTTEAVGFVQSAIEAIRTAQAAADEQDDQAARTALQGLRGTCDACHKQFREETADGFRIKR